MHHPNTVTIATENGPVTINESDFDEKVHELAKVADSNGDGKVTVKELKAKLDEMGVEYDSKANKASLEALLEDALAAANNGE